MDQLIFKQYPKSKEKTLEDHFSESRIEQHLIDG